MFLQRFISSWFWISQYIFFSGQTAITLSLVKWISAYLWQIKIEFVVALIPIFWVPELVDFKQFMMQIDFSPSTHPIYLSIYFPNYLGETSDISLGYQCHSEASHVQQWFYLNANLLNILLPRLFTSIMKSSFAI